MNTLHEDLKFLLKNGWRLVGVNTIESPDGSVTTNDIEKAARAWKTKLDLRKILEDKDNQKYFSF